MAEIHPTAIVDSKAELAGDVKIGAYAIIKGYVQIGPGSVIHEHSHVHGRTVMGSGCQIGPAAYVGLAPQHLKYAGEPTSLVMGNGVIIRETASIHRSFQPGPEHATRIGDRCFLMGAVHVAHDCVLGNDVVMANGVLLAGHVEVGERCFLGGGFVIHQFCRIGRLAVTAGNDAVSQDIPPFAAVRQRHLKGYNAVGCRRAGLSTEAITAIRTVYHLLRVHHLRSNALAAVAAEVPQTPEVIELVEFIKSSRRGIMPSWVPGRSRGEPDEIEP
jgi:UDP-N-acetylglucosamine acyltransferase